MEKKMGIPEGYEGFDLKTLYLYKNKEDLKRHRLHLADISLENKVPIFLQKN
jgi:hypothetical protein